jgi:heme exporter protein D
MTNVGFLLVASTSPSPTVGVQWTDAAEAWGAIASSMLTLAALVTTIVLAVADRRRSAKELREERRRGTRLLAAERRNSTMLQLRTFRISNLVETLTLYSEYKVASDPDGRRRLEIALDARLRTLPDEVASVVRFDTQLALSEAALSRAHEVAAARGKALVRPVAMDLVGWEAQENVERILGMTVP